MRKLYPGDEEDTSFFGYFVKFIGCTLISFSIFFSINSLISEIYWFSPFLIIGLGYLIFSLGFFIERRDKQQIIHSLKNNLIVVGILLILSILTWYNLS